MSSRASSAGFINKLCSTQVILSLLVVGAMISGLALRLIGAASYDLSGDDFFTFRNALENPFGRGLFSGYYVLTRISLVLFGENALAARLPALIFGILAVPIFYWRMRVNFGQVVAAFALAIFAFGVWHVEISFEARYYSGLFLFSLLCMSFYLEFLHTAKAKHLLLSLVFGGIACLFHFTGVLLFAVVGFYSLVALMVPVLRPNPASRTLLAYLVGVMALGGLVALPLVIFPLFSLWSGMENWGVAGWAIIPLMAFNHLSLPVFGAVCLGIVSLWFQPDRKAEWFFVIVAVAVACLTPTLLGTVMNMSPRYIFVLAPVFFISAGVFCADVFERLAARDPLIALAPCLLLIAASLPGVASHHLEKRNLSETALSRYIVEHAEPGDIVLGNVGSPLVDFSALDKRPPVASPLNRSYQWKQYLDENFLDNERTVWFALEVSREGIAPELRRWLMTHTEWVSEQRAGRIDRREREFSLWRKPPAEPVPAS